MATDLSFSDWLKARGIDEGSLHGNREAEDRRNQLFNFFSHDKAEPPPPPAADASGAALKVGDLVTLTLRVSGIKEHTSQKPDMVGVNLDRLTEDGGVEHYITVPAKYVKKV